MPRLVVRTLGQPLKNYLVNGDFSIWQRNAGPTTEDTSFTYKSTDRWQHRYDDLVASSTVRQYSRINDAPVAVINGTPNGVSAFRHIFRRGAGGTWISFLRQRVESYLAAEMYNQNPSGKVSVSVWVKSLTATNVTMTLATATVKDDFTSTTTVTAVNKTFTNNGVWQQIKWEGIPVTAAFVNGVSVFFDIRTPAAVGADASDQDLRVSMAQLNKGEVISDFSLCEVTPASELTLCQRYYHKLGFENSTYGGGWVGWQNSSGVWNCGMVRFPTRMRVTPALTVSSLAHWNFHVPGALDQAFNVYGVTFSNTGDSISNAGQEIGTEGWIIGGACPANPPRQINIYPNSGSAFLAWSAEL